MNKTNTNETNVYRIQKSQTAFDKNYLGHK